MISQQMEEYLEAIGKLEERGEAVTTSAVARECGVAAPTVSEMLRRLAEQGLIHYEPRKQIALAEAGRGLSNSVIRRHRLWERFLHDVLGLTWDKVHDLACEFEHVRSPDLERELVRFLGEHDTCPHGHIIPGQGAEAPREAPMPLTALPPGQSAQIVSIEDEAGALLRRLGTKGIRPGAMVCIDDATDEDTLGLTVDGRQGHLARGAAAQVRVRACHADESQLEPNDAIPLGALQAGECGVVHRFCAGRGLTARCLALGFTPGAEVTMLQNLHGGPVIVLVRDTRVALGRGEANKIMVLKEERRPWRRR
jgi:DtxR family Mn-dependent transcriptional regulator